MSQRGWQLLACLVVTVLGICALHWDEMGIVAPIAVGYVAVGLLIGFDAVRPRRRGRSGG